MALNGFTPNTKIESSKVNENFQGLSDGSEIVDATIDELNLTNLKQVSGLYNNGNSGTSKEIDFSNGDRQKVTITDDVTLTYANAIAGQILTLIVIEDGTGGWDITLPTTKWVDSAIPSFATGPNDINVLTILFDGTNYLTSLSADFG